MSVYVFAVDKSFNIIWSSHHPNGDAPYMDQQVTALVPEHERTKVRDVFTQVMLEGRTAEIKIDAPYWPADLADPPVIKHFHVRIIRADFPMVASIWIAVEIPNHHDINEQDREILSQLAEDKTIAQIAEGLGRAESTVELRIRTLKDKLGCRGLAGLVAAAIRMKIIGLASFELVL